MIIVAVTMMTLSCVAASPDESAGATSAAAPAPAIAAPVMAATPGRIGYAELKALLEAPEAGILLLDVRTKEEFDSGRVPGAILMPYDAIATSFAEPDRSRRIVVYCRSGRRSAIAADILAGMGYANVSDFGGVDGWKGALER